MQGKFILNGETINVHDVAPTTTVLEWLRSTGRSGTKEGCAEGDCGACTIAILDDESHAGPQWRGVCSCIMMLPQVFGKKLVTVEGLSTGNKLHPAQKAMVDALGSQCGYCTPGFVMSLFESTYRQDLDEPWKFDDQICGNLCRCTGYRPIQDALKTVAGTRPKDCFLEALDDSAEPEGIEYAHGGQSYARPVNWDDLWDALDVPSARLINGSTDLGLWVTQKNHHFEHLVDLGGLSDLRVINDIPTGVSIGAGVLLAELEAWSADRLPALAKMLRYFASRQIKNRATIGGNLCNASPIGDLPPVMLGLDAVAVIRSRHGERRVRFGGSALSEPGFWTNYRETSLQDGEILAAIEIPSVASGTYVSSYKVSKRKELDISAVSSTFAIRLNVNNEVEHLRLAYGGMAATPLRAYEAENCLLGSELTPELIERAVDSLRQDFTPLTDHRGTAWYRMEVASNLLRGFFDDFANQREVKLPARPSGTIMWGGES
ncbi:MAG: xanthine dehydrogenase small subunit [Bradymonadia bacterium]